MLIPIGQFSKMTRLSVKALRLYADKGLLIPAQIDSSTGYRYYLPAQANQAEVIRVLRSVEMPLDDIHEILSTDKHEEANKKLLLHRQKLSQQLAAQERMLSYLETIIQQKERDMPYEISITESLSQHIAAVTMNTNLKKITADISTGFGKLMSGLHESGAEPGGAPFIMYHDVLDEDTEGTIDICVPVKQAFNGSDSVDGRKLEGCHVATTIHHGPYEELSQAYHTITGWIAENHYEIAGPPREIYLNDPQQVDAKDLLTRLEFPVSKS